MKLWILRPLANELWEPWYDKAFGFVIRAEDEASAREYASQEAGCEGPQAWLGAAVSTCVELAPGGEAGVVIQDLRLA